MISFKPSVLYSGIIQKRFVCPICGKLFRLKFQATNCSKEHSCTHSETSFNYYIDEDSGDLSIYEYCENCFKSMRDFTCNTENRVKMRKVMDFLEKL
jgi:hypothetical protein